MIHLDVKKVGRIPDGGGWRIHGRGSDQHRAVSRAKNHARNRARPAVVQRGYVYLHSAVDGFSTTRLHRATGRREGPHRCRVPGPRQGLVRRPRHHPPPPRRHRQRRLLPLRRLRPDRRPQDPPPQDQTVHAQAQRKGRALPADPRRGTALRTRVQLRGRTRSSNRRLEHPLQLPSAAQRRGRPTASITAHHRRHQRPALVHLVGSDPDRPGHVGSTCPGVARHLCLRDVDVNGG